MFEQIKKAIHEKFAEYRALYLDLVEAVKKFYNITGILGYSNLIPKTKDTEGKLLHEAEVLKFTGTGKPVKTLAERFRMLNEAPEDDPLDAAEAPVEEEPKKKDDKIWKVGQEDDPEGDKKDDEGVDTDAGGDPASDAGGDAGGGGGGNPMKTDEPEDEEEPEEEAGGPYDEPPSSMVRIEKALKDLKKAGAEFIAQYGTGVYDEKKSDDIRKRLMDLTSREEAGDKQAIKNAVGKDPEFGSMISTVASLKERWERLSLGEDAALSYGSEFPDAEKQEIINAFNAIVSHFNKLSFSFRKLALAVNENDSWESIFEDIKGHLTAIHSNIGIINGKLKSGSIDHVAINNISGTSGHINALLNSYVKQTNDGALPEWFVKNCSKNMNWNFKIQVAYRMSIVALSTFNLLIERCQRLNPDVKSQPPVDDLLANAPKEVIDSIDNSEFSKKMFALSAKSIQDEKPASKAASLKERWEKLSEDAAQSYDSEFPDAKKAEAFIKNAVALSHNFTKVHHLFRRITSLYLKSYVKENDEWENTFNELFNELCEIYARLGMLNDYVKVRCINVPEIENLMDLVRASADIINGSVKRMNKSEPPEWFLKSNVSSGNNWNFKIQVAYWLSIRGAKTFFQMIDKLRAEGNQIKPSCEITNLMANAPPEIISQISNSHIAKEIHGKASKKALELQ